MKINEILSSSLAFRYKFDTPGQLEGQISSGDDFSEHSKKIRRSLYSDAVLIEKELFPEVHVAIEEVISNINPDLKFEAFIKPDPVPQAYCIAVGLDFQFAVVLTSALLELMTIQELKFVIGHEIGHYVFDHHKYPKPDEAKSEIEFLKRLYLSRCAEISADRMGFIACNNIDDASRAILKVASGLSDKYIKLNIASYVRQLNKLKSLDGYIDHAYSTHPVLPLRVRAMLWFSMSDQYYRHISSENEPTYSIAEMEDRIFKDLHNLSDKLLLVKEGEALSQLAFWAGIKISFHDKKLSKQEQGILSKYFDRALVDKCINFLKISPKDIPSVIDEKLNSAIQLAQDVRPQHMDETVEELKKLGNELHADKSYVESIIKEIRV